MKSFNKLFFGIILLMIISTPLLAQPEYIDDAAIWVSFNLEKKFNKRTVLNLSQQNRISENLSAYGRGSMGISLSYNLNKNIRIVGDYTFLKQPNLDRSYTNQHRSSAAIIIKKTIGKWDFSYRNMTQIRVKNIYSSYDGRVPKYYQRSKVLIKYDLNKYVNPYVSEELFFQLFQPSNTCLNKSRTTMGFDYKLTRKTEMGLYFLYQQALNAAQATSRYFVYGIGFKHEL